MKVELEFRGGAELLVNGLTRHSVELEDGKWTVARLLTWIRDNLIQRTPELFIQGDSVRPGILVLINDTGWDLLGELEYQVVENDHIIFISTLHGG